MVTESVAIPGSPEFEAESRLLSEYLMGQLSEEEEEIFESELAEDAQFFARMKPMIDFWYLSEPLPVEVEALARVDRRRVFRASLRKWGFMVAGLLLTARIGTTIALRFEKPAVVQQVVQQPPAQQKTPAPPETIPTRLARTPKERPLVVAEFPTFPILVDTGPTIGALPRPYAAHESVRIASSAPEEVVIPKWAHDVSIEPMKPNLSFLRKLQNGLGSVWTRIKHPRIGTVHRPR
jgi:hypothetical protein